MGWIPTLARAANKTDHSLLGSPTMFRKLNQLMMARFCAPRQAARTVCRPEAQAPRQLFVESLDDRSLPALMGLMGGVSNLSLLSHATAIIQSPQPVATVPAYEIPATSVSQDNVATKVTLSG